MPRALTGSTPMFLFGVKNGGRRISIPTDRTARMQSAAGNTSAVKKSCDKVHEFDERQTSLPTEPCQRIGADEDTVEIVDALPSEKLETEQSRSGKPKIGAARIFSLLKSTVTEWNRDKCAQLGAALAYYTIFSLAPLVIVLLGVFGLIYGSSDQARDKILEQLRSLVDPSAVKVIRDIAQNTAHPNASILATSIGIVVALLGASGIFGQLQDALNAIWKVKPKPKSGLWGFIRARFLSFAMVGGVCFLLLVSLAVEGLLQGLHAYLEPILPGGQFIGLAVFHLFDLVVITLLFAMIFRFLPDAKIAWRDVWTGAALTAVLFLVGKFLLGLYLAGGATGSAYGAAGSLMTLLLWIFYSTQILLLGAEFTKVYANTYGSRVEPKHYAVKLEINEIEVPKRAR